MAHRAGAGECGGRWEAEPQAGCGDRRTGRLCRRARDPALAAELMVLRAAAEVIGSMEHLSCEGRRRHLRVFSLQKRRFREISFTDFQYLKGPLGKVGTGFSAGFVAIGQGVLALNRKRVDLDWI